MVELVTTGRGGASRWRSIRPDGHQFFPDIDALDGTLAVIWQDNRTDDDYDVQFPIGNTLDEVGNPISSAGGSAIPMTTS